MKFQKFEISFLIFGSILVVVFNVILVAIKILVVFEIFEETSNKFAVKFLSSRTVQGRRSRVVLLFHFRKTALAGGQQTGSCGDNCRVIDASLMTGQ